MPGSIVIFGSLTSVAIATFYCALGGRWLAVRLLAVALSVALGARLFVASGVGSRSDAYFAMLLADMAAWLLSTLWLIRLAGYRLDWKWRFRRSTA